ncbi:MAG: ABC transporter permease [Lachnospiraceae bacterium]|nr:ABC transporter permease [Lachnospiraceae bacterium]
MNKFRGWKTVFSFTYRQNMKSKSYIAVTTIIAVLMFGLAMLLSTLAAKPEKAEEEDFEAPVFNWAEEVYVLDKDGLVFSETESPSFVPIAGPEYDKEYYPELKFIGVSGITEEELKIKAATQSDFAIGLVIEKEEDIIHVRAVVPSTSVISIEEGLEVAQVMADYVEQLRLEQSGLSGFMAGQINKEVMLSVSDAGEAQSVAVYMIQYFAPAIFGLVLYFLLLFYGQNINREVSTEKTSKLMETLLTSLHPYGLLAGKVFAIATVALQQFFIWIAAAVLGLVGGSILGGILYPEANESLRVMLEFLRTNIGESAFSPVAVVLSLVTFTFGFLFYCVLSGMSGSMVSRPEDAANTQSIFTLPIVISWITCYFGTLMENDALLAVVRNIPFTIPFCVPADLLTGAIGIGQGIVSTVILMVFSVLVIMLSGRIYKGMVLYTGQKINVKTIVGILKNKE